MRQQLKNGMRLAAAVLLLLTCPCGCGKKKSTADEEQLARERAEKLTRENVKKDNADAKALWEAVGAAVSDYMAWGGGSLAQINGDYAPSGTDFAEAAGESLNPKEKLLYFIQQHDDLHELPQAAFRLENGRCVYAAVQNLDVYGTYPEVLSTDDLPFLDSLQEAADYAKNGMNSRIQNHQ